MARRESRNVPQEPSELAECGCTEEPVPSGLHLAVISGPCSFPVEISVQQLLHPWELCALEGHICMSVAGTAAAVGEKEPGSV